MFRDFLVEVFANLKRSNTQKINNKPTNQMSPARNEKRLITRFHKSSDVNTSNYDRGQ